MGLVAAMQDQIDAAGSSAWIVSIPMPSTAAAARRASVSPAPGNTRAKSSRKSFRSSGSISDKKSEQGTSPCSLC